MKKKLGLRFAVVFCVAALVLIAGICLAAAKSPRISTFLASVSEDTYEKFFEKDGTHAESKAEEGREEYEMLLQQEAFWHNRLTYPTGRFDPEWLREAVTQDSQVERGVPAGRQDVADRTNSPLSLDPNGFTALGPKPERMTGCAGCYDYGVTQGRVNAIAVDPTTTTPGSIVAYAASNGGGVWKTTNCCSAATTWTMVTDAPIVSTTGVDTLAIDPNNHNTIYAGTGDLNFGSFSMGSQGILKSTDAGANWTVLGANVFGPAYNEPAGQFPQYDAVGKVRVDPNNSNRVVAGTKKGLFLSYDGGTNWTGPCATNSFSSQRQDTTGLELSNIGGGVTRIIAAVGPRGFATTVQYDLNQNGANGLYKATIPASGCPTDFTLVSRNDNGFVFGNAVSGSIYPTGASMNAGSGNPFVDSTTGNQLGRIDIAVAPSNPNYIYAQVSSIAINDSCQAAGCQLGMWSSIDGGTTWTFMEGSAGASFRDCTTSGTADPSSSFEGSGDYNQNWYDQGLAVDPNDPDRIFMDTYDTWLATRTGTAFYNVTCGYSSTSLAAHVVHVDHHALAFVPGSSNILLEGSDGGIYSTSNAAAAADDVLRPTWVNMDTGFNSIEFYSGDLSGNFATSSTPKAVAGAQDNGASSVTFTGSPIGGVQWQMGLGGDGFSGQIDPVGTGTQLRFWQGNNSGGLSRCVSNCTNSGASWSNAKGNWTNDTQSFILPIHLFRGGIAGGDDCGPAGATTGCGHLIAGTTRVWETVSGTNASVPSSAWYNSNLSSCNGTNACLTKGTLGTRSFITQVKYSPKFQSVAIVGTNDGNVQIGFNLGTGVANQGNWINVTGSNAVLPNRPILGVAVSPSSAAANVPVGYAAVGGFNLNTPTTPGHLFQVNCTALCASFTWLDKTGNLPNIPVDSVIVNPNFPQQVFAGADFGLYFTNDINAATPQWFRFTNGLPAVIIWDMQVDRGSTTLSLWTRGRGAFAWPLPLGPIGTPSVTPTVTPTGTNTPANTSTNTPTNTPTRTATNTPTNTATPSPLPSFTPAIYGTVTYGNSNGGVKFISNAIVTGTGSPNVVTTTDQPGINAGRYALTGLGSGSYTVSVSKLNGQNSISSLDAAQIAQHVAGTVPLTSDNKKVSADATDNGVISSNDASRIARYNVGIIDLPTTVNRWKFFLPPGPTFPVGASPTTRTYPSVTNAIVGQDYVGLLIGEVSGNWVPTGARTAASRSERPVNISLPSRVASAGDEVVIPVSIAGAANKGIISCEFDLRYDANVILPQIDPVDVTGTASRGLFAVANGAEPGLLRVAMYGPTPIDGKNILLRLRFTAVGAPGAVSPLKWERIMFNEGDPAGVAADGQIELPASVADEAEITGRVW